MKKNRVSLRSRYPLTINQHIIAMTLIAPVYTTPARLADVLQSQGYAVLSPASVRQFAHTESAEFDALKPAWADLPPDNYLKDGGSYRYRRHSCFVANGVGLQQSPHRSHWQPLEYNALHGGIKRLFEPVAAELVARPVWMRLLLAIAAVCSKIKGEQPWFIEAHQFRIDTRNGIGRPTPEGAHRDGVDFVAILLVDRVNIKGGESRVFAASSSRGERFTLIEPWTLLLLDDERVIHESTPIQPTADGGYRDTLVLTYRRGGFLE